MPDHIYVQLDNNGPSVVLASRNGTVIFKHEEEMTAQKARKIVSQLLPKMPEADVHEFRYDGGQRSSEKRRNVREWEEGWKAIDAARDTHEQLTPDNELIGEDGQVQKPTALSVDLSDINTDVE